MKLGTILLVIGISWATVGLASAGAAQETILKGIACQLPAGSSTKVEDALKGLGYKMSPLGDSFVINGTLSLWGVPIHQIHVQSDPEAYLLTFPAGVEKALVEGGKLDRDKFSKRYYKKTRYGQFSVASMPGVTQVTLAGCYLLTAIEP